MSKRLFDLTCGATALIVLAPVLLLAAAAIAITSGRPILHNSTRTGLHGRQFTMHKFRTMRPLAPHESIPEHDQVRVTAVGRVLRRTSIDELPSLLNIVRGQMSFVGPRPLPTRYVPRYSEHQLRRLEVRPGLTGLAQSSGRNSLSWNERFDLDVHYVDSRTMASDIAIIWRTILPVLGASDTDTEAGTTMPEFWGTHAETSDDQ